MNKNNIFSKLKAQTINENEKDGLEKMFKMMIWLRQQIRLRRRFNDEK